MSSVFRSATASLLAYCGVKLIFRVPLRGIEIPWIGIDSRASGNGKISPGHHTKCDAWDLLAYQSWNSIHDKQGGNAVGKKEIRLSIQMSTFHQESSINCDDVDGLLFLNNNADE